MKQEFSFHNTIPSKSARTGISHTTLTYLTRQEILVNHKLTPLVLTSTVVYGLRSAWYRIYPHIARHIEMHVSHTGLVEYNRNTRRWDKRQMRPLPTGEKRCSLCRFRATPCRDCDRIACRQTPSRNTASAYLRNLMCAISPKPS